MNGCSRSRALRGVTFLPGGHVVDALPGEMLLDSARRGGVRITAVCGGRGLCKSCVVRIVDGVAGEASAADSRFFSDVELAQGWRRACQSVAVAGCRVEIPSRARAVPLRTDVTSEDAFVRPALSGAVTGAIRRGELIARPAGDAPLPGLAVDIGTTNIGLLLADLRTGRTLARGGIENPQGALGGDIITRIAFANTRLEAARELQRLVVEAINNAALSLCRARGLDAGAIVDIVMAGNTAMQHLVAGLPVDRLGRAPFVPSVSGPLDVRAKDLGLQAAPGAWVHLLPGIGGFVGGDHTAVLLAIGALGEERTVTVLDIGTNTEISLLRQGRLTSLSCPSGPAFEGGHIRCGMRSAAGAIESVRIEAGSVRVGIIDGAAPAGICGSGVLDAAAQLYLAGIVDAGGRMAGAHRDLRQKQGRVEFVLAPNREPAGRDIVFAQEDVRAVQLAKSAIRSGIAILLDDAGIGEPDLDEVIIAGAFGNYLRIGSAIAVGMLPPLPPDRFAQIGNAALIGAKLALVSAAHRAEAEAIAARSRYVELAGYARFSREFMARLPFPARDSVREASGHADT